MEYSSFTQLNDLPDEILVIILQKLNNCDVLYSLMGVNQRLDKIVKDRFFARHLCFFKSGDEQFDAIVSHPICRKPLTMRTFLDDLFSCLPNRIVDRFCSDILPKINEKIERFDIDSSLMQRIFLTADYPHLRSLGLYNLTEEIAYNQLFSHNSVMQRYQSQIISLTIQMKQTTAASKMFYFDKYTYIYRRTYTVFKNLQSLNFSSSDDEKLAFPYPIPLENSANLIELHVVIGNIGDCLSLLDGRFNQLQKLCVIICPRRASHWACPSNKEKLPSLKQFSFIHEDKVWYYKEIFLPLLDRMINLEELDLNISVGCGTLIDGNYLTNNVIGKTSRIREFTFSIRSILALNQLNTSPTNEQIAETFLKFQGDRIMSCVDIFPRLNQFRCHVYSYPYRWISYDWISNQFRHGFYQSVRQIYLYDEQAFEHEFFIRINQSFPYVKKLTLHNCEEQQNHSQQCSIIKYCHLMAIDLCEAHEDYVEEFLNDTKTCLANDIYLRCTSSALEKATNNFTRDATRINASKIVGLRVLGKNPDFLQKLKDYFACAEVE